MIRPAFNGFTRFRKARPMAVLAMPTCRACQGSTLGSYGEQCRSCKGRGFAVVKGGSVVRKEHFR